MEGKLCPGSGKSDKRRQENLGLASLTHVHVHMHALSLLLVRLNVDSNLLQLITDGVCVCVWGGGIPMSYHLLAALSPPE